MTRETPDYEDLLTPAETAAAFRVTVSTTRRWQSEGKLTEIRTPGGARRYRKTEVLALLKASETPRVA